MPLMALLAWGFSRCAFTLKHPRLIYMAELDGSLSLAAYEAGKLGRRVPYF